MALALDQIQASDKVADKILSRPKLSTVTIGAKVTYECVTRWVPGVNSAETQYDWYYYYDNTTARQYDKPFVVEGPSGKGAEGALWREAEWTFPGQHMIKCFVTMPGQAPYYVVYRQHVDRTEAVVGNYLFNQMKGMGKRPRLPHPDVELSTAGRYIATIKAAEKRWPSEKGGEKEEAYLKKLKSLDEYCERLTELLEKSPDQIRIPIYAAHVATENQQQTMLRVYVARNKESGPGEEIWRVVDWTNPTRRELRGTYEGRGATKAEAIRHAIDLWKGGANAQGYSFSGNRYYPGQIVYDVPREICGDSIAGFFETTGGNDLDTFQKFLSYVAQATTILAGALAFVVPGSQPLAFALWASVFSSISAAAINMGQRHDEGFNSWKEDVSDTLTIAGSILGAANWARGAKIICDTKQRGLATYILVGSITSDSAQGILLLADDYQQYEEIMRDRKLSPDERTDKLLKFFAGLAVNSTLTFISIKGSAEDLKRLRAGQTNHTLQELKDPNKTIDTTEPIPVQGHTRDQEVRATTYDQPHRPETKDVPQAAQYKKPPSPNERGMRNQDHVAFVATSAEDKLIIIVRDSSHYAIDHLGKYKIKAKPEAVKAKTRKTPPNVGLAAVDPNDGGLKAMLEKKNMSYDEYVTMLEEEGFHVMGKSEGYIIRDNDGYAFTSDYDLHGVYKQGSGKDAYSDAFREKMNDYFMDENIQHGPHDKWTDRQDIGHAGVNYGPQPPVTAYLPDGSIVHLQTVAEMKSFYLANNIDWNALYGKIDWQKYKAMQEKMGKTVVLPE